MADSRPTSFRVRIAGQEILVPDLDTLQRLARTGQIGAAAEVRPPGQGSWLPLAEVIGGVSARRDPWAAWEEADHVDPKSIWKEFGAPAEEEPTSPIVPLRPEVREPNSGAMRPRVEDPGQVYVQDLPQDLGDDTDEVDPPPPRVEVVRPARRPAGKVIAFPTRPGAPSRTRNDGANALAEPVPLRVPTVQREEEETDSSSPYVVRWGRVGAVGALATVAMLFVVMYVTGPATMNYPRHAEIPSSSVMKPVATEPTTPAPPPAETVAPPTSTTLPDKTTADAVHTEALVYEQMEASLRLQLSADVQEVSPVKPLEDALLIELRRMRLDVVRVHAPVVGWAGRKNDVPQAAEVHITVRTSQVDFDRDVGAVALVAGKYIQRYSLDVPVFELTFEGLGTTALTLPVEGERARQFYLQRKTLLQFLTKK